MININQLSQFETGRKTTQATKADTDEKQLIEINHNKKKLFVIGNYHSGTRWLNYLIIKNTPSNHLYTLRNQNQYLDDSNIIQRHFKHGVLNDKLLSQKNIVIIYTIRDFDNFLKSYLKKPYGTKIKNNIVYVSNATKEKKKLISTNMNVYEWYCYMIESNISLLKNSESNNIIVSMEQIQKTEGESLLNILETHGFEFKKPYDFINKHTKTEKKNTQNQERCNTSKEKFERNNKKIENIIQNLNKQPEIKISWN